MIINFSFLTKGAIIRFHTDYTDYTPKIKKTLIKRKKTLKLTSLTLFERYLKK